MTNRTPHGWLSTSPFQPPILKKQILFNQQDSPPTRLQEGYHPCPHLQCHFQYPVPLPGSLLVGGRGCSLSNTRSGGGGGLPIQSQVWWVTYPVPGLGVPYPVLDPGGPLSSPRSGRGSPIQSQVREGVPYPVPGLSPPPPRGCVGSSHQ